MRQLKNRILYCSSDSLHTFQELYLFFVPDCSIVYTLDPVICIKQPPYLLLTVPDICTSKQKAHINGIPLRPHPNNRKATHMH